MPLAPTAILVIHLVSGLAVVISVGALLRRHVWFRRRHVLRHRNARYGLLALACFILLIVSGLALLRWTNVVPLRWIHGLALVALSIDLIFHAAWRIRQTGWSGLRTRRVGTRIPIRVVLALAPAVVVLLLAGYARVTVTPSTAADETVSVVHAGLGDQKLVSAQDCATCHGDIVAQWNVSAHKHAATDPYYVALTGLFIQERGVEAARYCATCHNPIGLLQGEIDEGADVVAGADTGGAAYQARKLDKPLSVSTHAAEGVNCAVCHQAAKAAEQPVNGSLGLATNITVLPNDTLSRIGLTAAPATHREEFARPVLQEAALCGSCHNLRLPDSGLALEPTYDEWLASPYPAEGKTCQTCHLPEVSGQKVATGLPGTVKAHGGAPGAPSSLPGLSDDPRLLQSAATLAAMLRADPADPETLLATVAVTNSGAGHYLPTGADDLRQVWLEVTLADAAGRTRWQSGVLDHADTLDPSTVQFHKVLGDKNGQPIQLHRFWMTEQILKDTRLAPKERRDVIYRIPSAGAAGGPYRLTVRLLYRDVSRAFAEFALQRPVTDLPAVEMARVETGWEPSR